MSEQSNPNPAPEFIAEHTGPEVYIPTPTPGGRSDRILEETARRLGWSGNRPQA